MSPNRRSDWMPGYYLTDIKPDEAEAARSGQLSFAMFGQPYAWESSTSANYDEFTFTDNRPPQLRPTYAPLPGGEPHFIYRVDALPGSVVNSSVVNFLPGAPGAADVPAGTRYPAAQNGTWFTPGTQQVSLAAGFGINSATGRDWRADMDWLPSVGSSQRSITGAQVIKFRRGYPDFATWSAFTAELKPMTGKNSTDFREFNSQLATAENAAGGVPWAENELKTRAVPTANGEMAQPRPRDMPNWTWHHHEDMRHMLLVPGWINDIPHIGGAPMADAGRR